MLSLLCIHSPFQQRRDGHLSFMGNCDHVEGETVLNIGKESHPLHQMGSERQRNHQKMRKSKVKGKSIP